MKKSELKQLIKEVIREDELPKLIHGLKSIEGKTVKSVAMKSEYSAGISFTDGTTIFIEAGVGFDDELYIGTTSRCR
jgi:hypothetical protein